MGITERICKYLDFKKITRYRFYKETGLSNGFLDKKGNIGSDKCERIIYQYKDLNPDWLLTGQGEMLRSEGGSQNLHQIPESQPSQQTEVITLLKEQLKEKEAELKELYQEIGQLKLKTKELEDKVRGLDLSGSSSSHTRAHSQDVTSVTVPSKK